MLSLVILAPLGAHAQQRTESPRNADAFPQTCGVFGSGDGAEGRLEFGAPTNPVEVVISNALTGEKIWPRSAGRYVVRPNPGGLDLLMDTSDNRGPFAYVDRGRLYLTRAFYVLSFYIDSNGVTPPTTTHVAWDAYKAVAPVIGASAHSFYNPVPEDRTVDTCFILDVDSGELDISTTDVQAAGGGGAAVNDILGNDGWTLPYDVFALCAAQNVPGCLVGVPSSGVRPGQFISYKAQVTPVQGQFGEGYKLVPSFRFASAVRTPASYPAHTWDVPNLVARFAPGASLTTAGILNATGTTFTADDPAAGWAGVRFESGSGGTWTNATVERVRGDDPFVITQPQPAAIRITGASPGFTNLFLRDPVQNTRLIGISVNGVSGYTTAPVASNSTIQGMMTAGVSANGGGRIDLIRGDILDGGDAVLTGGSTSRAYLIPSYDMAGGGLFRGPTFTTNGRGIVASGGSEVRTGTANASNPGFGLTTITNSATRAVTAYTGAAIYAGTGAPGSGNYQRNRIFSNAVNDATGNGLAVGTGSRIYARCTWWNSQNPGAFRVGQTSGGLFDASYYLTADPFTTPDPLCVPAKGVNGPEQRSAAGAEDMRASLDDESSAPLAGRGTPEMEATALDRLAQALSAPAPAGAVAILASLVADLPETETAAAALGEAGVIAQRPDAPASAVALLVSATESADASLRVAAWQSLVATRRALGDGPGALAAADALAAEGALVSASTARVYLYGEAGDTAQAEAALAVLEQAAPGSIELELARAFLGVEAPLGGRPGGDAPSRDALGGDSVDAEKMTSAQALASGAAGVLSLAVVPNPAGASATVLVSVPEAADVSLAVYDLLGRAVLTPDVGAVPVGAHRVPVSVSGLAPGVYVVRAVVTTDAGAEARTVRLTVAR